MPSPAEKVEEKPLSALEALEQAAMDGDDDEFNLCFLVCSFGYFLMQTNTITIGYNYIPLSSFPRLEYDHLSFLLNYKSFEYKKCYS